MSEIVAQQTQRTILPLFREHKPFVVCWISRCTHAKHVITTVKVSKKLTCVFAWKSNIAWTTTFTCHVIFLLAKQQPCDPAGRRPGATVTAPSAPHCCHQIIGRWVTRQSARDLISSICVSNWSFTSHVRGPRRLWALTCSLFGFSIMPFNHKFPHLLYELHLLNSIKTVKKSRMFDKANMLWTYSAQCISN